MTPTDLLVPTYVQMLTALSNWLEKAAKQLPPEEAEALLSAKLAPDMFPLSTQVRFACVQAQEGMYRLRGEEFPPAIDLLLDEGRNAGEQPGTLAEAKTRIDETVSLVKTLSADTEEGDPDRPIAHALPMGIVFDLTAQQYARDWTLGQFYFHIMIAYAILRNQGIDLGKADYVTHMFAYLRPGTAPSE
ncbi:hypothetical protein MB02_05375 [Croceicoccus estronivorus]|uniref:DUF1993 domain-containing protein n=1 Tax=Croceicoccus estronivorus TaxID=1172626 RepID=UPI00082CEBE0|nr:DUF1993 domain-containing protein [Croceicoccus estronivorus]OCC24888.1 hypothetical protein MB02_05375 [Croceicoccus estronivorus]